MDEVATRPKTLLDVTVEDGRVPPVLHRDIAPSNVIVREDGRPALVDVGAVASGFGTDTATGAVRTPWYSVRERFSEV
jgi:serine/threonine protein kinase